MCGAFEITEIWFLGIENNIHMIGLLPFKMVKFIMKFKI